MKTSAVTNIIRQIHTHSERSKCEVAYTTALFCKTYNVLLKGTSKISSVIISWEFYNEGCFLE